MGTQRVLLLVTRVGSWATNGNTARKGKGRSSGRCLRVQLIVKHPPLQMSLSPCRCGTFVPRICMREREGRRPCCGAPSLLRCGGCIVVTVPFLPRKNPSSGRYLKILRHQSGRHPTVRFLFLSHSENDTVRFCTLLKLGLNKCWRVILTWTTNPCVRRKSNKPIKIQIKHN